MSLSLLSALQIQENETFVGTYQDKASGKYGYAITHNEERHFRLIVSCNPVYDSNDDALTVGTELMLQVKELDLSPQKRLLIDAIDGKEVRTIDSIVQCSK